MRRIKTKMKGFTLIELSLSLIFIGILSLTVAYIINDTIASYRKGVALKQINTVGMSLVDDMRASIQNSSVRSVKNDCSVVYKGIYSGADAATAMRACEEDGGRRFVSVVRTGEVVGRNGSDVVGKVPVYGAFCAGDYSYIWNSGYFFNDENNAYKVQGVSPASLKVNLSERLVEDGASEGAVSFEGFRLLKVRDSSRSVCIAAAGAGYEGEVGNVFDLTKTNKVINERPVDLLASDESSGGLALYDLDVSAPAESTTKSNVFYLVSFILGTVQGGINVQKTGGTCSTPDDLEVQNFDYCAINKFNFAAQAIGG